MTGQIQPRSAAPLARPIMPMAPTAAVQSTMTPQDILRILWRHWKLIAIFAVAGLLIGGLWYGIENIYSPRFTTIALIQVLPQEEKDPTILGDTALNKDTQYQFRNTLANRFNARRNWLDTFIQNLKKTDPTSADFPAAWYKELQKQSWLAPKDDIVRADRYFKKHLAISVDREANIIKMTLYCNGPAQKEDGAKILKKIGEIFQAMLENDVKIKWSGYIANLQNQRKDIQDALDNGPLKTLKDLRTNYSFGNLSGINFRDYMEETKAFCKKNGYVLTLFGRKCHYPEIGASNASIRAFNERASINARLQGTAADIIKLAMIRLHGELVRRSLPVRLLLQVHDELVLEVERRGGDTPHTVLTFANASGRLPSAPFWQEDQARMKSLTKLTALEILSPNLKNPEDKVLTLVIPYPREDDDILEELKTVIKSHPGPNQVLIRIMGREKVTVLDLKDSYRVETSSSLFAELRSLLGESNVTLQ